MPLYALDDHKVETSGPGTYWVAPTASVIGRVVLAPDVSIWFGASLRGDNEPITIGPRTNVQEGCVMHVDPGFPVTIAANCTIGHGAIIHGCEIEEGVLIGMGAIVLNGAKIGAGSLIGAGALVPEGKIIPPGSVVMGSPGKVIRQVRSEEVERIAGGVESYCKRWRHYAQGLQLQSE